MTLRLGSGTARVVILAIRDQLAAIADEIVGATYDAEMVAL